MEIEQSLYESYEENWSNPEWDKPFESFVISVEPPFETDSDYESDSDSEFEPESESEAEEEEQMEFDLEPRDEESNAACFDLVPPDVLPVNDWESMSVEETDLLINFAKESTEIFQSNVKIAPMKGGRQKMMAWARDYSGIVNKEEYVAYSKEPYPHQIDDNQDWFCYRQIKENRGFFYVCEFWLRFSGMGSLANVKKFNAVMKHIKGLKHLRQLPRGRIIALQIRKFTIKEEIGKDEPAGAQAKPVKVETEST